MEGMEDKKSKFAEAESVDETKEPNQLQKQGDKNPDKPHKEVKKHYDSLQVRVAKNSDVRKWQEIRLSTQLPERRSYGCSCIYKDR